MRKILSNLSMTKLPPSEFLYYLAPIGDPQLEEKLCILENNLRYIYISLGFKFDIAVNTYCECQESLGKIKTFLQNSRFINQFFFYQHKGILTEVFLRNPDNDFFCKQYKYIMFIMDDVAIKNMPIKEAVRLLKRYDCHAISPKVLGSTYEEWWGNGLSVLNRCEIFCLLLNKNCFNLFLNMFAEWNPYFWGVDYLMGFQRFNVLAYSFFECCHKMKNFSPEETKRAEFYMNQQIEFETLGKFKTLEDIEKEYPLVKKHIYKI